MLTVGIWLCDNNRLPDPGYTFECRFGFAELDSEATNFYLMVETTEEFESTIRLASYRVTCTIHTSAGCCREGIS